ncbi:cyclic GMP-AMP synthase-like receptor [Zeugodacus cucurbitae]|uniref:cyclic GMP-AMP synthase-like receptor n=1 Tax=Zeugodacus cucurbitae TaxID=28588 RepID=UPI0005969BE4|nr:cyclic GMP-AMP synthase-like receptor [Zeugodacus cucurbitae]
MVHYQNLRNKLFESLKAQSPLFKLLFNGQQLQGSYGDNVKVGHPDEYDLVFFLKIPKQEELIITEDPDCPGNVFIDVQNVLNALKNEKGDSLIYEKLRTWTTSENESEYLNIEKLQFWLKSCFDKALLAMKSSGVLKNFKFVYRRCGPAHTMFVDEPQKFSVDFVPAIVLGQSAERHGIPKPVEGQKSFRVSYFAEEQKLMKDKKALKNALRIMKKFRDSHSNMANLKSYYIKTLFLWKTAEVENSYWDSRLCDVITDMFKQLKLSLDEGRLEFYWNKNLNLYGFMNEKKIREMRYYIMGVYEEIFYAHERMYLQQHKAHRILSIFLTKAERRQCLPLIGRHIKNRYQREVRAVKRFKASHITTATAAGVSHYEEMFTYRATAINDNYMLKEEITYISDGGEPFLHNLSEGCLIELYNLFDYDERCFHNSIMY